VFLKIAEAAPERLDEAEARLWPPKPDAVGEQSRYERPPEVKSEPPEEPAWTKRRLGDRPTPTEPPGKPEAQSGPTAALNKLISETADRPISQEDLAAASQQVRENLSIPMWVPPQAPEEWRRLSYELIVARLNREHAVVRNVGKATLVAAKMMIKDYPLQREIVFQNQTDFRLQYSHVPCFVRVYEAGGSVKTASKTLGEWWLRSPDRENVDGMAFAPGKPKVIEENWARYINLWTGFAVRPRRGKCDKIKYHIREV
jgi:hypothetical protein